MSRVPGLAADRGSRGRRDPLLAGSEGPPHGGDMGGAGGPPPRRRRPEVPRIPLPGSASAVALAPEPAGYRRDTAGPVCHPRRRRSRRRAGLLAGPGALGGTGSFGLAPEKPALRCRGPGAAAPDSAAHAGGDGHAGPGWLAGGLRQAAACSQRPRARRPRHLLAPPPVDALAGGHRRAWIVCRRLVRRTEPDRAGYRRVLRSAHDHGLLPLPGCALGRIITCREAIAVENPR